jgi:DNA-directed RNA polymerase subunit RPC12/RpoP
MCHICAKTFPTQGVLKGHLYSHVAKSEQKQCLECGKWLKSDLTLRVHMRSHSGRVFRCPHCSKAFKCKQNMRDHMRSHSSARPYKCLVCGKTFKLRSGLRVSKYMPAPETAEVYIGLYLQSSFTFFPFASLSSTSSCLVPCCCNALWYGAYTLLCIVCLL